MPLNAIPATTTAAALATKRACAAQQSYVDVGFIGGVVAGNETELDALHGAAVLAWKCFLVDSGVAEFPAVDEGVLRRAMPRLAAWGLPLMVHAELPGPIAAAARDGAVRRYADYVATRPVEAETEAVALVLRLARECGTHVHIVHVSSAEAARMIGAARARGVPVTAETCPHYLSFAAEDVPDGATAFKCAPPIRDARQRDGLWAALEEGLLDMIVSDHSPAPAARKSFERGDFMTAWGGIASLQLGLSAVWTGARARGIALERVVRWMAERPADLVRLRRKGRIATGCHADFAVFEPSATWTVDARQLQHRHAITAYQGLTLAGRVRATYLRGERIYDGDNFPAVPGGRLLHRDEA
jgi:allantoinase